MQTVVSESGDTAQAGLLEEVVQIIIDYEKA
jgi:hypothetical protein